MEKQKTSSKRKAATKVIVAVLLIAIMTGISFAVANFVHNRKSVQASSVKNGLSAYELAVQQGYAGSLDDWLVSLQGKSAYQIAVDNGYSGSEKDWSKTLTAMSKKDKSDISSAAFSEKGDLVITLSDGTKINVGKAVGASGKDGKDGKDGIGIKSAKINDKGELVISYSDGNSVNLDKVVGETVNNGVGIASSIINEKGELVLTYTNGEIANLGGVVGKDGRDGKNGADGKDGRDGTDGTNGTDGISVAAAVINENGELIITYSDGTTANLGKIVGSDGINGVNGTNGTDGKDGISVSSAEINSEGELVLSFSNGQRANVGAVVGAKGDKGEQGLRGAKGEKGDKGENGLNGSDGIGVKKSEINSAGELVITYTNDLTENLGPVVGAKGDKGDKGEKGDRGAQGDKGERGERGVQGEKGDAGLGGADGKDGKDGVGINNIEISNDGNLLITLTNGTSLNLGNIKGAKGDQGIQGEKGEKGDQGIQGEKGDKGDAGLGGIDGKDGKDGTNGVGVASSEINALGELVIKYSNGTTVNLGRVVGNDGAQGIQGEKGDKGDQGIQGEKGDKGDQGIQGEKGDKGDQGLNGTDGKDGTNGTDGVGITDVTLNSDDELVLTFSNGNVINLGNIKGSKGDKGDKGDAGLNGSDGKDGVGIQNVDVSADGALTVTLTNGTVLNLGNIKGADGLGITKAEINTSGELVLTYSNGDVKNLGKVIGENGKDGANGTDGIGIKSLTLSPDGELVVTMSDNSISNLGNIKGDKGDRGEKGQQGLQGTKGADGRGIAKTELVNGELVITYTDGTSDNLGTINNSIEYLKFTYNSSSNSYMVSVKSDCKDVVKNIVIPEKYNGVSVTKIAMFGFANCPLLESVVMPDTITEIYPTPKDAYIGAGDGIIVGGAFKNCPKLSKVKLSNNLKNLPSGLFIGCSSLKEISIPASVRVIGTYDSSKDTRFLTDGQSVFSSSIVKVYVENTENWMRSSSYHANDYKSKVSADVDPQLLSDPETAATLLKETYSDGVTEKMYIYEQKSSK